MNNKSPHILNTAASLLGFSFLVLTSIKGFNLPQTGLVDEFVSLLMIIFAISCILSFISLRLKNEHLSLKYETGADYVFFAGLLITVILAFLLSFDIILFA